MGWVRKLFAELQGNYGTRFLDMWRSGQADTNGDDVGLQNAMDMWAEKLAGFRERPDAIRRVLDTLPPHPPTLPEFVALCRQSCPKPEHKAHLEAMLGEVHQQFIKAVKDGRGDRLKLNTPGLFTGLIWSGNKAVENGLADGLGSVDSVAREITKAEDLIDYTVEENAFDKFARKLGTSFGAGIRKRF